MGMVKELELKSWKTSELIRVFVPVIISLIFVVVLDGFRGTPYFTLAPLFPILAMAGWHGGLVSAVAVGVVMGWFGIHAAADINIIRTLIIICSVIMTLIPIIILRKSLDNAGGILSQMREIDIQLTGTLQRWRSLSEADRLAAVKQLHHRIAHCTTFAMGWYELAREKESVLRDYEKK